MGMSLSAFTVLHVVLSLVALAAGVVVAAGFVTSRPMPGITARSVSPCPVSSSSARSVT